MGGGLYSRFAFDTVVSRARSALLIAASLGEGALVAVGGRASSLLGEETLPPKSLSKAQVV